MGLIPGASAAERARADRLRARRRWIWRTGLMLTVSAIFLIGLVVWRRDVVTIEVHNRHMTEMAALLQAEVDQLGRLPASPHLSPDKTISIAYYATDADRWYARQSGQPTIIGITSLVPLMLKESGRGVLIFHAGRIEGRWMGATEFRAVWADQQRRQEAFELQRLQAPPALP